MLKTRFERLRRLPFWLAAPVLILAYMAGVLGGSEHTFGSDDPAILESVKADMPVRYVGYLFSKSLAWLYRQNDTIPWYGLSLCAGHFVSLCLLAIALRLANGPAAFRWLTALFCFSLFTPFLIVINYNAASILLGAHALLCFRVLLKRATVPPFAFVLLGIAFSSAFELRKQGMLAAVTFCLPVVALGFVTARNLRWRRSILFAAPALAVIALDVGLYHTQMTDQFRHFLTFNPSFQGYGIIAANETNYELMAANGWSANDYVLLGRWFFVDEKRFNLETFDRVRKDAWRRTHAHTARQLRRAARQNRGHLGILILWVGLTAVLCGRKRAGLALLYVVYCGAVIATMVALFKYPARIGTPLGLAMIGGVALMALDSDDHRERSPGIARQVAVALLLLIPTVRAWTLLGDLSDRAKDRLKSFDADIAKLETLGPGGIFLFQSGPAMRWSRMSPFRRGGFNFEQIRTGWLSFSPMYLAAAARLGARQPSEILPRMIGNEKSFIVARPGLIPNVLIYLEEAHDLKPELLDLGSLTTGAHVYRLIRGGSDGEPKRAIRGSPD